MVLVYGASGLLGRQICRRLRERRVPVRALLLHNTSRESIEALRTLDVELFIADLHELPIVAAACSGAQAVICADPLVMPCHNGPPLDASGARCLIELSNSLGVRRFVLITVPQEFITPCAIVSARDEAFARLEAHSMDFAVLEAGFVMESWLSPALDFNYPEGSVTIYGDGTQKLAWVSYKDLAELAARSLDVDHRRKHRIRVAAPEKMSPFDVIRHFEELCGWEIQVTRIPETELLAEHKSARDPADRVRAAMKVEYARGLPMRADYDEIPIVPSSVRKYAQCATTAPDAPETWSAGTAFG